MARTTLRRVKQGVYGVGVDPRPQFAAFFFGDEGDGLRGWAYRYAGGSQGALLGQKDFPEMGGFVAAAVISYSPLVVVIQASGGPLYVWNVNGATVTTITTHPAAGYSWLTIGGGGDGFVYWLEVQAGSPDTVRLFRVDASAAVTECVQSGGNLVATGDVSFMGATFVDGVVGFTPVSETGGGILQLAISGGDEPHHRVSADWLPTPNTKWEGWNQGHRIPGAAAAVGAQVDPDTSTYLRLGKLHGQEGGDQTLFGYEALVDPFEQPVLSVIPNAAGTHFALTSLAGGTDGLGALVSTSEPTDAGDIEFYTLEAGPGFGYPFFMVPV